MNITNLKELQSKSYMASVDIYGPQRDISFFSSYWNSLGASQIFYEGIHPPSKADFRSEQEGGAEESVHYLHIF